MVHLNREKWFKWAILVAVALMALVLLIAALSGTGLDYLP